VDKVFTVNNRQFSRKNALIIAELGTAHNADLNRAKAMTDAASDAGADCIKFQIVYADEILHPNTGEVALPGGKIRLYDRFKQLEVSVDFFSEIKAYVEKQGLLFLCTPFGPKSAAILRSLNPDLVKIASPELNYSSLLRQISAWRLPTLLSSGVSTLGDIEEALFTLAGTESGQPDKENICLLHCVTAYPAPVADYNLRVLHNLAEIFGVTTGVSDHSLDPELVPALAVSQGAAAIEKHFCLSRDDPGLDDPIALPPSLFARMVKAAREASETSPEETRRKFSRDRGTELVESVLGTGIKELAPSEKANYKRTNRSIHAIHDIHAGKIINKEDFAVLRTEKVLKPGLPPSWESLLSGRKAQNFIPSGEGIRFEDI
jgi:sialic acid synthase SpsE